MVRVSWRGLCIVAFLSANTGCATVTLGAAADPSATEGRPQTERIALVEAGSALAAQPWGTIDDQGLASMLFGAAPSRSKAGVVDDYVELVRASTDQPALTVLADADAALAKARRVVEAGRQSIAALQPLTTDVEILETAIADTRHCKTVFVAALETLAQKDRSVRTRTIDEVRDAFAQTIADMSHTADLVAERLPQPPVATTVALPDAERATLTAFD